MDDYRPMQRIIFFKNTYMLDKNKTVNADGSCGRAISFFYSENGRLIFKSVNLFKS